MSFPNNLNSFITEYTIEVVKKLAGLNFYYEWNNFIQICEIIMVNTKNKWCQIIIINTINEVVKKTEKWRCNKTI